MLKYVSLLLLLFQFGLAEANAQSQFKRRFFDGCAAAKEAFKSLEAAERQEALIFMGRVLGLQGEMSLDVVNSVATVNQTSIVRDNPLLTRPQFGPNPPASRSGLVEFDSEQRVLAAKKCALELLDELAPETAVALPELIEASAKGNSTETLNTGVRELVFRLVQQLRQSDKLTPSKETINRLIKLLAERVSRPLVENVLIEWKLYSVPLMLEQIAGPEGAELRKVLLRLDPAGIELLPALRKLLVSTKAEERLAAIKLLGRTSIAKFQAACDVLPLIESSEQEVAEEVRRYLSSVLANDVYLEGCAGRESLLLKWLTGDSPQLQELASRFSEQAILDGAALSRELLAKYPESAPAIKSRILSLLASSSEPRVREFLSSAIYEKDLEQRALRLFPQSSLEPEVRASTLLRRYKAAIAETELERRRELVMTLVEVVSADSRLGNKERFIPLFLDSLALAPEVSPEQHPGVLSLIPYSEQAQRQLLRLAEESSGLRSKRAAYVLEEALVPSERLPLFEQALTKALVGPLPERARSRALIKNLSAVLPPKELERIPAKHSLCSSRKGAELKACTEPCEVQRLAYLLAQSSGLSEQSKFSQFASKIDEACRSSTTCAEWQLIAEVVPESKLSSLGIAEALGVCLKKTSDPLEFESLLSSSQQLSGHLAEGMREALLGFLAPAALPREFQLKILALLLKDGRAIPEYGNILKLLPSGDSELDTKVLELINSGAGIKFDAVTLNIFDADVQDTALKSLMKSFWANHSEAQDWALRLLAAVDGLKGEDARNLFSLLSNSRLASVLSKARTRDEFALLLEEMCNRVSRAKGEGLIEALPRIIELSKEDSARIRTRAIYLAFALAAERPEVSAMFEAELQGPEGYRLLEFKYPLSNANLFLSWRRSTKSEVLKLAAQSLLENTLL